MKRKIFWIASGILLMALLVLQVTFHPVSSDLSLVALDAVAASFTHLVFGAIAAAVLSIIPYKSWPYAKKFEAVLPFTIFIILLIFTIIFGYMEYQTQVNGIEFHPVRLN